MASKNTNRKRKEKRAEVRAFIRARDGDNCLWCGKPMLFPEEGVNLSPEELRQMATIEHHLAKLQKKGDNIDYLALTHQKCNL